MVEYSGWYNWLIIDVGFQFSNWFIEIGVGKAIGNRKIERYREFGTQPIRGHDIFSDKFIKLGVGDIWKIKLN